MATTAIAEVPNPGSLISGFSAPPFKWKRITVTGGSAAGAAQGTTAWATGVGVTFPATALGWRVVTAAIVEGNWVNAAKTGALAATPEIVTNGATVRVYSHGSNGVAPAALNELTSDLFTCTMIVAGY